MNIKRRSFLGISLGGLVAGPSALAKKVAEQAGFSTINKFGTGAQVYGDLTPGPSTDDYGGRSIGDNAKKYVESQQKKLLNLKTLKFLKPAWFEQKRRERAREVYALDLDLAAMNSMSLAAKVAIQRERNYKRYLDDEEEYITRRIKEKMFGGDEPLGF